MRNQHRACRNGTGSGLHETKSGLPIRLLETIPGAAIGEPITARCADSPLTNDPHTSVGRAATGRELRSSAWDSSGYVTEQCNPGRYYEVV